MILIIALPLTFTIEIGLLTRENQKPYFTPYVVTHNVSSS